MGYYSYISGGAHVTPPIDEKDWPEGEDGYDGKKVYFNYFEIENVPGDQTVAVVNGQVTVVGTDPGYTRVDFAFDDNVKAYDIDEQMQNLFDWARQHGSEIKGTFTRSGEESPDYQRYRFDGKDYFNESPEIVWPDGSKGQ